MKVTMDIELKDEPGQLILALEPVSNNKANLISVFHYHKVSGMTKAGGGKVHVQLVLDAKVSVIEKIKVDMEKAGIRILRIGEEKYRETIKVVVIGHVVDTDIRDTISRIDITGIAEVTDMSLSMPEIDKPTSAVITISAIGTAELKKIVAILKETAEEKNLLLVLPVEIE